MSLRFKTDENLPVEAVALLRGAGHDAESVLDESLCGKPDEAIAARAVAEARAVITLDQDFQDIRHYPPGDFAGLVVLQLRKQSRDYVLGVLKRLLPLFHSEPLAGRLWVVDEAQVRIRE